MPWSWWQKTWNQYKYRFVPWIVLNLKSNTKIRDIKPSSEDKIISDNTAITYLEDYYTNLSNCTPFQFSDLKLTDTRLREVHYRHLEATYDSLGFTVERRESKVDKLGRGVYVTKGSVPRHTLVALYPGTVYQSHEPILIQSINNKFIFKCSDSVLIDGNDRGLSRFLYKSLSERDRCGPYRVCDQTWLTDYPWNTLSIGQYVNNATSERRANVAYQELVLPESFPLELLRFHCNVSYSPREEGTGYKTVVLVAVREIEEGEELLSTYFTIIRNN